MDIIANWCITLGVGSYNSGFFPLSHICRSYLIVSIATILHVKKEDVPLMYTVYFAFFVSGIMNTLIGTILPLMKSEYNMSYVLCGAAISARQIENFFALLISGFLPYHIGRKKSIIILSFGFVVGFLLMTLMGNPLFLLLTFLLTGIGRGTSPMW